LLKQPDNQELANNLLRIAEMLRDRQPARAKKAA